MTTIVTSLQGATTPPAVLVAVDALPADTTRVNIYREAPGEPARLVRGGYGVDPAGTALLTVDLEAELGRPLVYVVEVFTASSSTATQTSAAPVTVPDPGRHVLSHALTGASVLVDLIGDGDEREQTVDGATLRPLGARRPVALYDTRADDTGTLRVHTRDRAETLALVELLEDGAPLVSRHPFDGCDVAGVEVLYFPSSTRTRRRRDGSRLWELPFFVVDTVDPQLTATVVTLADLDAYYAPAGTLATRELDHVSLFELARFDFAGAP